MYFKQKINKKINNNNKLIKIKIKIISNKKYNKNKLTYHYLIKINKKLKILNKK